MATRYIWEKYNVNTNLTLSPLNTPIITYDGYEEYYPFSGGDALELYMHPDYYNGGKSLTEGCTIYYSSSATFTGKRVDGQYGCLYELQLSNPLSITFSSIKMTKSFTIPQGNYFCIGSSTFWAIDMAYANSYCSEDGIDYSYYDLLETHYDDDDEERYKPYRITAMYAYEEYKYTAYLDGYGIYYIYEDGTLRTPIADNTMTQGSRIDYISSTSNSTYPSNGISGSYWYKYITSNTITDPTAITITSSPVIAGGYSSYTITSSSNANGYGTIYYHVYFAYNNSSTYTQSHATTTKTGSMLIPSYTSNNIRLRVHITDGIGYRSSYIYSPWYNVSSYTTYACVAGAVKGVSPIVCVGGSIKTSVNTKKCVGGVVKS